MEKSLLENLRQNQAFDAAVAKGKSIDKILAAYLYAILFQPDPAVRAAAIKSVEAALVAQYTTAIQPAAIKTALANAQRVMSKLTGPKLLPAPPPPPGTPPSILPSGLPDFVTIDIRTPPDVVTGAARDIILRSLDDPVARRRILIDSGLRAADRAKIVQHLVNDAANTLDNRLAAYWLEPGQSTAAKVQQLRDLHAKQAVARAKYDQQLEAYQKGDLATRPRKPQLKFTDRFAEDVKNDFRAQARRAGGDAEIAAFTKAGYAVLAWIVVNGAQACPDCRLRQGVKGDAEFWDKWGRPGDGRTVCGDHCYCLLVPGETLTDNPGLRNGLNQPKKGVLTSPADAAALNAAR